MEHAQSASPAASPAAMVTPGVPARTNPVTRKLLKAAKQLSQSLASLQFSPPVTHCYDPLDYAWAGYEAYLTRYGQGCKRIMFLGMNPGPFGMMQTGVPFGEVNVVRNWMGIDVQIQKPAQQHAKRPIEGFSCTKSEVSGCRLWGWAKERWGSLDAFFQEAIVLNYCPLVFLEDSGKNRTPAKLPVAERKVLEGHCDKYLAQVIDALHPEYVLGIGSYAEKRLTRVVNQGLIGGPLASQLKTGKILHPSPANPKANQRWSQEVDWQMQGLGLQATSRAIRRQCHSV